MLAVRARPAHAEPLQLVLGGRRGGGGRLLALPPPLLPMPKQRGRGQPLRLEEALAGALLPQLLCELEV